ncbi:putative ATP-binding cassette transporter ABCA1 [Trypanosoma rangeli]|uniref:Putative ATP-binding cassette transporter ABCA1 n=1 Tax=Trypanosoma rangeli TaxID=5698 RepID=A0A422NRJ5_TRYRA|nr:putative ATP-binding cassette transporter ABCA1 [Trypanosoma rangeli]RNF08066.1 putative ATP-binding cassette transporter ABCA1 [Trypanosoma rangeli]|eukprot:RNF08066.1 putative ATP-binding cassette transporter ABCA1 [Trypanosoma rangeli]
MSSAHTILLTTHYMGEADLLGHQIGIMSSDSLQCSGSSLFLKSKLRLGHGLVMAVHPDGYFESINGLVEEGIEGAEFLSRNGFQLSYRMPLSEASIFPGLLDSIENHVDYGLRGYSILATALEDVFLRVPRREEEDSTFSEDYSCLWGYGLTLSSVVSQFCATLWKCFGDALRDRGMQFFQLFFPFVCVLLAMLLSLINFKAKDKLVLSFGLYDNPVLMDTTQCQGFLVVVVVVGILVCRAWQ